MDVGGGCRSGENAATASSKPLCPDSGADNVLWSGEMAFVSDTLWFAARGSADVGGVSDVGSGCRRGENVVATSYKACSSVWSLCPDSASPIQKEQKPFPHPRRRRNLKIEESASQSESRNYEAKLSPITVLLHSCTYSILIPELTLKIIIFSVRQSALQGF